MANLQRNCFSSTGGTFRYNGDTILTLFDKAASTKVITRCTLQLAASQFGQIMCSVISPELRMTSCRLWKPLFRRLLHTICMEHQTEIQHTVVLHVLCMIVYSTV
jgi:hypothetical protein